MGKYTKINPISLALLNNAEILNLLKRTRPLIPAGTPGGGSGEEDRPGELALGDINTKVGISDGELEAFDADITLLEDIVNQSRVSNETAKLATLEKERDEAVVYFNAEVSNQRKSPIPAIKEAANALYNETHVYVGIQTLPDQQETQKINGLLADLDKPENKAHVAALHQTEVIEALRTANKQFEVLTASRTTAKAANKTDNAKTVRTRLEPLFDDMMTISFVYSVAFPSEEATAFITNMNALIDEVKSLYNLRRGIAVAAKSKKPADDERPGELKV